MYKIQIYVEQIPNGIIELLYEEIKASARSVEVIYPANEVV